MHPHKDSHPHHNSGHPHSAGPPSNDTLRLVAWEATRSCNLACVHCRAEAHPEPYPGELTTDQGKKLLDEIASMGQPIVILTGGEPMMRQDIYELASYGTKKGLRMVMSPNGTLITPETTQKMVDSGIKRVSISIDGATADVHDTFRGVPGAFDASMKGIQLLRDAGIDYQINTTITRKNLDQIPAILELATKHDAAAHHIFLLVPTGRAKEIAEQAIDAAAYEQTLNWFYDQREQTSLQLKATCAPHYYRILRQRAKEDGKTVNFETHGLDAVTRGCLGGTGFCFVSHTGIVQPCGYLHLNCGDVTKVPFDEIWKNSEIFNTLRDYDNYKGKCGACEYKRVCGGCRARAFEATGDYLTEEPLCTYIPKSMRP